MTEVANFQNLLMDENVDGLRGQSRSVTVLAGYIEWTSKVVSLSRRYPRVVSLWRSLCEIGQTIVRAIKKQQFN